MSSDTAPSSTISRARNLAVAIAGSSALFAMVIAIANSPAQAQVSRHTTIATPRGVVHSHTVVDRSRAGWWRGHPGFAHYHGPRHGHYFAPGYGYYPVPRAHVRSVWVVGSPFPASMRRYVVINPVGYGLAPAPHGYGWYYAGTNFVLVSIATGVIIQSVAGGW